MKRLLFLTQSVDPAHPVLAATIPKIRALAERVDEVIVLGQSGGRAGLPAAAALAYAWSARKERPPAWRVALFATGLLLIAASLNSPLETIAVRRLLLVHLLQNALIADIAPPLILLGLTPAMRSWLDAHGALRLRARYALPAWLAAWYGTHLAGFYDWALRSEWPLNVEHALLIAGGLLFWWPLVSGRLAPPAAVAYLGAGKR